MEGKKNFRARRNQIFASLLAAVLILTSTWMLGVHADSTAFAANGTETIELELKTEDETNNLDDRVVLSVNITKMPASGLSGIALTLRCPDAFVITNVEDKQLLGTDPEQNQPGTSKDYTDNPYFISFGNMNEDEGGLSKTPGELVRFTLEPKADAKPIGAGTHTFSLEAVTPVTFVEEDGQIKQIEVQTTGTLSCQYTSIAGDGTADANKILLLAGQTEACSVKTETIQTAVQNADGKNEIVFAFESDTSQNVTDALASVTVSKAGLAAISASEKQMSLSSDAGRAVFSKEALLALQQNTPEGNLTLSLQKQSGKASDGTAVQNAVNLSLSAQSGGQDIQDLWDAEAEISVDLPTALQETEELVYMIYDTESKQYKLLTDGIRSDDGKTFAFKTAQFGDYLIGKKTDLLAYADENGFSSGVSVSGVVKSYNPNHDITVQLIQGGVEKYKTIIAKTSGSGQITQNFTVDSVEAGTYDLVVTKAGHLQYTITGVAVGSDDIDLNSANYSLKAYQTITLLSGDVNGDGSINEDDVTVIRYPNNINKLVEAADNALADVNGDGSINEDDVTIVRYAAHINKSILNCTYSYN